MVLPFLLVEMLYQLEDNINRMRVFILSGCRQVRKNKRTTQPLLKGIAIQEVLPKI
jgi:hypothetical protein